jgi:hypothetical protein
LTLAELKTVCNAATGELQPSWPWACSPGCALATAAPCDGAKRI